MATFLLLWKDNMAAISTAYTPSDLSDTEFKIMFNGSAFFLKINDKINRYTLKQDAGCAVVVISEFHNQNLSSKAVTFESEIHDPSAQQKLTEYTQKHRRQLEFLVQTHLSSKLCEVIKDSDIDVNVAHQSGTTLLHVMAHNFVSKPLLNLLSERHRRSPFNVMNKDKRGDLPIHVAARTGNQPMIHWLLSVGDKKQLRVVNNNGDNALHCAAQYYSEFGGQAFLIIFRRAPELVIMPNHDGIWPFDVMYEDLITVSVVHQLEELVDNIVDKKDDSISRNSEENESRLGRLLACAKTYRSLLQTSQQSPVQTTNPTKSHRLNYFYELTKEALQALKKETYSREVSTPVISFKILSKVVSQAIQAGEVKHTTSYMRSLLCCSVCLGNHNLTSRLLEGEADPNIADFNGKTPLMHAVIKKDPTLVIMLINKEADVFLLERQNNSALFYAFRGNKAGARNNEWQIILLDKAVDQAIAKKQKGLVVSSEDSFLTFLVKYGNLDQVKRFVQALAIGSSDIEFTAALDVAIELNLVNMSNYLISINT